MIRKDHYNHEFANLSQLIRTAEEKKYILSKGLYDLGELSYEKSSREGDYDIRDKIKKINEHVGNYYNAIRLFDNGMRGDIKAYEDILVYFQNNYIDSFIIGDNIGELRAEILRQKEDSTPGSPDAGRTPDNDSSVYISELEAKINRFESKITIEILPVLNKFLTTVNLILLSEKVRILIEQAVKKDEFTATEERIRNLRNLIITFLWLHLKITGDSFSRTELRSFIINTIRESEFLEPLSHKAGITGAHVDEIAAEIAGELQITTRSSAREDAARPGTVGSGLSDTSVEAAAVLRLKEVLKNLHSLSLPEGQNYDSLIIPEYGAAENLRKSGSNRYLFNVPGSFQVNLKWIADYMNNSLLFIYDWVHQEIQKNTLSREIAVTLIDSINRSDEFARAYATALVLSAKESNRKETFFEGEIHQYIPAGLAGLLAGRINDTCEFLDEAFAGLFIHMAGNPSGTAKVLNKKLDIVHSSFRSARQKIMQQLRRVKV